MMDTAYWVGLHKTLFFKAKKYMLLKQHFTSPEEIWRADPNSLKKTGLTDQDINKIVELRNNFNPGQEMEKLIKTDTKVLFFDDLAYPQNLKNIYDPPALLYIKGRIEPLDSRSIAVVGARKPSPYGVMVAEKIAGDLAQNDVCVVSGMARGIDTAAHRGSLKKRGKTIAVLGSGLDQVYPRENKGLMEEIAVCGAVITEFPLGTAPQPVNFPIRNRIISGLSMGTVVVEAAEKSGSLITADQALEQGREVFAVPGNITNNLSKGPHKLIKQGAKLVGDISDILEEFGWNEEPASNEQKHVQVSLEENLIYHQLSVEPVHIEKLIEISGLTSSKVSSMLMLMELRGMVHKLPGQYYVINAL